MYLQGSINVDVASGDTDGLGLRFGVLNPLVQVDSDFIFLDFEVGSHGTLGEERKQ